MGIDPYWGGVAFAAASVWDGITDPVMGAIADRTRTRHGKYRPYLLYMSVPCAVSFVLMFYAPPLEGGWLVAYAVSTHILFRTFYTTVNIPFCMLSSTITNDANERGWLAALRIMFAASGALIVAYSIPKFIQLFPDDRLAYLFAASLLAVGATVLILISFASSQELPCDEPDTKNPSAQDRQLKMAGILEDARAFWSMLSANKPLAFFLQRSPSVQLPEPCIPKRSYTGSNTTCRTLR
jgi:GPH family glycoside/pentoside/hexuronide:cation symporter